jgi:hypothetical protein
MGGGFICGAYGLSYIAGVSKRYAYSNTPGLNVSGTIQSFNGSVLNVRPNGENKTEING